MKKKDILIGLYIFSLFFILSFIITPMALKDVANDPLGLSYLQTAGMPVVIAFITTPFTLGFTLCALLLIGGALLIGYGVVRMKRPSK